MAFSLDQRLGRRWSAVLQRVQAKPGLKSNEIPNFARLVRPFGEILAVCAEQKSFLLLVLLYQSYKLVVVVEGSPFCGQTAFSVAYQVLAVCVTLFTPSGLRASRLGTKSGFASALWITMEMLKSYTQDCA